MPTAYRKKKPQLHNLNPFLTIAYSDPANFTVLRPNYSRFPLFAVSFSGPEETVSGVHDSLQNFIVHPSTATTPRRSAFRIFRYHRQYDPLRSVSVGSLAKFRRIPEDVDCWLTAGRYLPKTINFHLGEDAPKIVPVEPKAQSATPNLIQSLASKLGSRQPSPPSTPAGEVAGENFFLKSAIQTSSAVLGLAVTAISSRPAPSRQLTQPRSRASSPPPSNILQARPGFKKEPDIEAVSGAPKPHRVIRRQPSVKDQAELFKKADWTVENAEKGNGGLRQAIRAAEATKAVADVTWVGTLGMSTDILEDQMKQQIEEKLRDEHDCLPVFCKDRDFDGHYRHFCKQILWPYVSQSSMI